VAFDLLGDDEVAVPIQLLDAVRRRLDEQGVADAELDVVEALADEFAAPAEREDGRVVPLAEPRGDERLADERRPGRDDDLDEVLPAFGRLQFGLVTLTGTRSSPSASSNSTSVSRSVRRANTSPTWISFGPSGSRNTWL
jgi:hypothetical protein